MLVLVVLLLYVSPVWHSGCADQNCAGNGPEQSARGGCNPGMGDHSTLDSLRPGQGPLEPYPLKRKRGGGRPQPSKASSRKKVRTTNRRFACHYYLHDRIGHSDCQYKRLGRLSDVRQHLLNRTHKQVVHCPLCGITFTEENARQLRDAHVQEATCERSPSPFNYPGITEDEERRIRDIARDGRTTQYNEVQRWNGIWDVLFPGVPPPDSPFLTEDPEIQHMLDQTAAVFSGDHWLALLHIDPWTPAMPREQQRLAMLAFVESVIRQVGRVEEQNTAPAEDDHTTGNSSHIEIETQDLSGTRTSLGVMSLPSFDSNDFTPVSAQGPVSSRPDTRPGQVTGPNPFEQMGLNPGELPAAEATAQTQNILHPASDVSQATQGEGAPSGPATAVNDPTLSSLPFPDFPADIAIDFEFYLNNPFLLDYDARREGNHAPPDEEENGEGL